MIYHAANKLLKSASRGDVWAEVSPDLTTNDQAKMPTGKGGDGNIQYCTITTIDESPIVRDLLYAGTDDGNVWVTKDGGKNWTKLNDKIAGNPGFWVSRVLASRHQPGTAYVTYTGYRHDDSKAVHLQDHRLRPDLGVDRRQPAGQGRQRDPRRPEEPEPAVRRDRLRPVRHASMAARRWAEMKSNMPTQPVHDLVIHRRENDLIVATHGRGIFITDISPLQETGAERHGLEDFHLFEWSRR